MSLWGGAVNVKSSSRWDSWNDEREDILPRLRKMNACTSGCYGRCKECPNDLAAEAAKEIERLRGELRDVKLERDDLWKRAYGYGDTVC